MKDMTLDKFWNFMLRRMLVTYLTLIPSFFLTMISLSPPSLGIFVIQVILVLIGTFVMYRKYDEEKTIEFTKKLGVFVEKFKDKMTDPAYIYSLHSIALEVARKKEVFNKTRAWDKLLSTLSEDLTNKVCALHEKIETSSGKEFTSLFEDFRQILTSLKKFKKRFYEMVDEIGKINFALIFGLDAQFQGRFNRLHKEYNGYMDRLAIFSDDIKAKLGLALDEDLIQHIHSLSELCKTIYP